MVYVSVALGAVLHIPHREYYAVIPRLTNRVAELQI